MKILFRKLNKKSVIWLVSITIILVWIIWGNTSVKLNYMSLTCKNLPSEFSGYKIAQISDLHNAEFGENNLVLIEILKDSEPDIIVITGDIVDANHTNYDIAVEFVKNAVKIAPCYYVTGNHEAWLISSYYKLEEAMVEAGVNVLHNEVVSLKQGNDTIQLIGVDDPIFLGDTYGYNIPENYVSDKLKPIITTDDFIIMLSHRPELFNEYVENEIDLVFSGHVHGGQFRIPFIGGVISPDQSLFPKYDSGVYTDDNTTMVVSRGIGNSVIPVRINNRPEIVVVELVAE